MAILKLLQLLCGLAGIGLTIFGIVSLVQGEWLLVVLSIVGYVVLSFIWYPINQAIAGLETRRFGVDPF